MSDFDVIAQQEQPRVLALEVVALLRQSKKLWLLPIVTALFLFGALVALSGTAAAPFIYSLF